MSWLNKHDASLALGVFAVVASAELYNAGYNVAAGFVLFLALREYQITTALRDMQREIGGNL